MIEVRFLENFAKALDEKKWDHKKLWMRKDGEIITRSSVFISKEKRVRIRVMSEYIWTMR